MQCLLCFVLITIGQIINATTPYCLKNITKLEWVPKIQEKQVVLTTGAVLSSFKIPQSKVVNYVVHEEIVTFELLDRCCLGYRMNSFNICEPICDDVKCGDFEVCVEPNRCSCKGGYKSVDTAAKDGRMYCLPICAGGCGKNGQCYAPNLCKCDQRYVRSLEEAATGICGKRCRPGLFWDPLTLECVEKQEANVTLIAAEMDLLMPALESKEEESKADDGRDDSKTFEIPFVDGEGSFTGRSPSTGHTSDRRGNWFSGFTLIIIVGATLLLISWRVITLYFHKRSGSENAAILEGSNAFYGDYITDRSQIFVC